MEVLLLAFANDRTQPLQTLADEYAALHKTLAPRTLRQHFLASLLSHATLDDIGYYLTLFRDQIRLFLFSGHAGRDLLLTETGAARAEGIAHLLAQCPRLQVVILNGCSTDGQVAALHAAGIPLVIATQSPVGDAAATQFSTRLFQALETGLSIAEAFEQGIGAATALRAISVQRSMGFESADDAAWRLCAHPDQPDAGQWKLPTQAARAARAPFGENELLLETLYEAFAAHHPRVGELRAAGATLDERAEEIIAALLRALPAPVSEHVRKLVAPSPPGTDDGWDTAGPRRLAQLGQTYQIAMDFMVYVHFAQLWESAIQHGAQFQLPPALAASFRSFFELEGNARRDCDHFSLLRQLREALETNGEQPFVRELQQFRAAFVEDESVRNACFFLANLLRAGETASAAEAAELCFRAEECLALVFGKWGFLGQYLLATVRNIDVRKYRHTGQAEFEHLVVKWHGTLGIYEKEFPRAPEFMDNRSVVLLRAPFAASAA
jgi:hypothetical protein